MKTNRSRRPILRVYYQLKDPIGLIFSTRYFRQYLVRKLLPERFSFLLLLKQITWLFKFRYGYFFIFALGFVFFLLFWLLTFLFIIDTLILHKLGILWWLLLFLLFLNWGILMLVFASGTMLLRNDLWSIDAGHKKVLTLQWLLYNFLFSFVLLFLLVWLSLFRLLFTCNFLWIFIFWWFILFVFGLELLFAFRLRGLMTFFKDVFVFLLIFIFRLYMKFIHFGDFFLFILFCFHLCSILSLKSLWIFQTFSLYSIR